MMRLDEVTVDGWERIVRFRDEGAGLDAIVAVHDTTLGPACGGVRIFPFGSFEEALEDVKRLSRGMTFKNALGGIPFGGGKAVIIADPKRDKTEEMFRAFGRALNQLEGLYYTAEDSGATEHDLQIVQSVSKFVGGISTEGIGGNPSPFTARGVWRGIEAAVRARLARNSLRGLKVSILGVGAVGMALAELLHDAGADLIVADVNADAVRRAVDRFGASAVSPLEAVGAEADIFSPCALGGAISSETLPRLKATIVAGAANNQLATPEMDRALMQRGILYAPDYVINAAGVISVGLEILGDWHEAELTRRIDAIGPRLGQIFERAAREGSATGAIADELAREIIAKAKMAA